MNINRLIIITDTREQKNAHILERFENMGIQVVGRKMPTGDYSFILDGEDFSDRFLIERKANWGELYGNLAAVDIQRFKAEFKRAEQVDRFILLIEEYMGYDSIQFMPKPNFKMNKSAFKAKIQLFIQLRQRERKDAGKPAFGVLFAKKIDVADLMLKLIVMFIIDINHKKYIVESKK